MMKLLYLIALIVTGLFTLLPGRIMHSVLFGRLNELTTRAPQSGTERYGGGRVEGAV